MTDNLTTAFTQSRPLFISLEGGDGTGKTSQIKRLSNWFTEMGIDHITTREPGGTEVGASIRKILLTGDSDKMDPLTETLLFYADRCAHLEQVVRPALAAGKWVLCDRFADATAVYQGVCKGVPMEQIHTLEKMVIGDDWPDQTLLLDVPVDIGLGRKNPMFLDGLDENRMESEGHDFHKNVRNGLLERAKAVPQRYTVVNASPDPDTVFESIQQALINFVERKSRAA